MKRMIRKSWFLLLTTVIIAACSTDAINDSEFIAGESFTDSNIRVMQIDTMTVLTSTMKYDSIITSNASRILVGKYNDPIFGTVSSASYMEFVPESYTIDTEAVYDSLVIYLKYDGYFYNDTLPASNLILTELQDRLEPVEDEFYNTSSVAKKSGTLAISTFQPRPLSSDSLMIKINDSLGVGIYENLLEKRIVNSEEFKTFFKGLVIEPEETDNGSVIGFSIAQSFMRLYVTESEENGQVQNFIDFNINVSSSPIPFFNRITSENQSEYLSSFSSQEDALLSTQSDNQSFVQSGIGISTRIQFPHIETLFDIPGEGTLLGAVLKLKPSIGTYDEIRNLRDTLSVYVVDQNNDIVEQLNIQELSTVRAILNRENQEFNDIYYELPLSSYIEELLTGERSNEEALILLPPDYNSTVDRLVLNNSFSEENTTTLEITYAIYDEEKN